MAHESILVIDDDELLAAAIESKLSSNGFKVALAGTVSEGRKSFAAAKPDLVVLDLMLPDGDGMDICRDIRRESSLPVMILTARAEVLDRVLGLELGADDYVTKPFNLAELTARVKALLRRCHVTPPPAEPEVHVLESDGIVVDLRAKRVTVNGEEVSLSPIEFRILAALMRDPGAVVATEDIVQAAWGRQLSDVRSVAVHIANLRGKLARASDSPDLIQNVRSFGYRMAQPAEAST